ncbi:MAG: SDR family oxidoreductase [Gammaproteobacteria bacterium]|nr:SDR family oxidoreductase [Gammaproteobacteria bacterium]
MSLKNQTVVIIGGSSGIGLSCAETALARGARVIIGSRSADKLHAAASRLNGNIETRQVDFTQAEQVEALFASIEQIDHLLLPAVEFTPGSILEQDINAARASFESKFWGPYYCAKFAAPKIKSGGSILFVSGVAGRKPLPGFSALSAACGAIESLTMQLAMELAPVRVNCLSPGVIDTPALDKVPEEQREAFKQACVEQLFIKHIGSSDEIAHAAAFLMENSYTTGSVLNVDGGFVYS